MRSSLGQNAARVYKQENAYKEQAPPALQELPGGHTALPFEAEVVGF
jgi:hypothetical protein